MRVGAAGADPVAAAPESVRSPAILPFDNLKQDEEIAWLSDAMAEAIHQKLGRMEGIVVRRGSVPLNQFTADGKSRSDAAKHLDVDVLVSGSFLQHEGSLRFNVSLIHGRDGRDDPLGQFDDATGNLFQIQNDVALAIAGQVRTSLTAEEKSRIAESLGIDPAAYRLYREGIHAYDKFTAGGFAEAERLFRESLEKDPGYDDAANLLSVIPWMQSIWGGGKLTPELALQQSRAIFDQFEEGLRHPGRLDNSRSWIALFGDRDWVKAERLFRGYRDDFPESSSAKSGYGRYLSMVEGRTLEALRQMDLALGEEPDRINFLHDKADIQNIAGDYSSRGTRTTGIRSPIPPFAS
jgi:TolB-like protein